MKKLFNLVLLLIAIVSLTSCPNIEPVKPPQNGNDGSIEKPYSVAQAKKLKSGMVFVKGYVVGYMYNKSGDDNSAQYEVYSAEQVEDTTITSNILIADDINKPQDYMPIQLPVGVIRENLNLADNADVFNKEVLLYGQVAQYFEMPALKGVSYAVLGEEEFGVKPADKKDQVYAHLFNSKTDADFTTYNVEGEQVWSFGSSYVQISGHVGGSNGTKYSNEDWLISPTITLPDEDVYMYFEHALRYVTNIPKEAVVLISTNYKDGNPNNAQWTDLNADMTAGSDWTPIKVPAISLNNYKGQKVRIAFKYTSTSSMAATWELFSFYVLKGTPVKEEDNYLFYEYFNKSLGDFTVLDVENDADADIWAFDSQYGCVKATAYVGGTKYNSEVYLVSPEIDLTSVEAATLTYDHAGKYYTTPKEEWTLWVTTGDGKNVDDTWTRLTIDAYPTDFTFVTATVDLKDYVGQKIHLAFGYQSSNGNASTYEIKNVIVK